MDWKTYISPFLSIFLTLFQFTISELTPEECRDLGFSVNLICSSCDELKPFNLTSELSLEQNCRKCCQADGQEEATKTTLVRCPQQHPSMITQVPQVTAFVRSDRPAKFPNLRINFVRGADPVLKLHDESNEVKEVLSIEKWNTDSVEEFLNERLAK
ncbi:selenoprotein F-like [Stylophora pistillata]|uniref:selenoprotein F-like n=1 Tax=Stylophora pistillata TaxID=50429 RepID=UPI000C04D043|nr:selenoprotein F-like [Stylophora pistillata]